MTQLVAEVADLKRQLARHSGNSSLPPSSDPPWLTRPPKPPTGRSPGGQPGHKKHKRELLPVEQVDKLVDLLPSECESCAARLVGKDREPRRHQVTEIPAITPHVTEYREHALACRCGHVTRGRWPDGVPRTAFGPVLMATIAVLTSKFRLSKRATEELVSDLLGVEISLGAISKTEALVSAAVAAPVDDARAFVQQQPVVNADETGWRETNDRAWLWTACTPTVTVFRIDPSRGKGAAQRLLGPDFAGLLGVDRWSAYGWIDVARRQLCWAHLTRDFEAIAEQPGLAGGLGRTLLAQVAKLFEWWHRVRDGTMSRATFRRRMQPVADAVGRLLRVGETCAHAATAGTCRHILKREHALWTFVREAGVEPTNNAAERALRQAVLWRKGSFGTHSATGSRFVERMLTVVTTLRSQGRHVISYVADAVRASLMRATAPSLLPNA